MGFIVIVVYYYLIYIPLFLLLKLHTSSSHNSSPSCLSIYLYTPPQSKMLTASSLLLLLSALSTSTTLAAIFPVTTPVGFFDNGAQIGIGSWFRASADQDATNGKSWCGYKYQDGDKVFAVVRPPHIPLASLELTFRWCGLESEEVRRRNILF